MNRTGRSVAGRVALLSVSALLFISGESVAACHPDAVFRSFNRINETSRTIRQDMAFSEGVVEARTNGRRNINARVPSLPVPGAFNTRATWPVTGHVWELSIPLAAHPKISVNDLMVIYSVSGGSGRTGYFQSVDIPTSVMKITVIPRQIIRTVVDGMIVFMGYIDLDVDYSAVTVAGSYNGTINAVVECR